MSKPEYLWVSRNRNKHLMTFSGYAILSRKYFRVSHEKEVNLVAVIFILAVLILYSLIQTGWTVQSAAPQN